MKFKNFLFLVVFVVSTVGTFLLAAMIGFDEGRNYQAYKDSRTVASCNEVIAGWSK